MGPAESPEEARAQEDPRTSWPLAAQSPFQNLPPSVQVAFAEAPAERLVFSDNPEETSLWHAVPTLSQTAS